MDSLFFTLNSAARSVSKDSAVALAVARNKIGKSAESSSKSIVSVVRTIGETLCHHLSMFGKKRIQGVLRLASINCLTRLSSGVIVLGSAISLGSAIEIT